jgi:predicted glutamine amidotransferase
MFGVAGSTELARELQEALIAAARHDDFSTKNPIHKDGWGGIFYSQHEQNFVRSTIPIFDDKQAPNFFSISEGNLTGLSHARLKAKGEPVNGPFDSHPFAIHFAEELAYVEHNGHINKKRLGKIVALDVSKLNDSEVFSYLIESMSGNFEERFRKAIRVVYDRDALIGALNLIALEITRNGKRRVYYYWDDNNSSKESPRKLYYPLYVLKDRRGSAVMSSTVAYKMGLIDENGKPLSGKIRESKKKEVFVLT